LKSEQIQIEGICVFIVLILGILFGNLLSAIVQRNGWPTKKALTETDGMPVGLTIR
jgi:hypothetical protein